MLNQETATYTPITADMLQQFALQANRGNRQKALVNLKKGIWLYLLLLLVEGGLRKWVLPGLATPLLLVRDPVAIWLMTYGYMHGFFKSNAYAVYVYLITAIAFIFSLLTGHGNLFVALYGARITLIHFPLVFLIGQVFTEADLIKTGRAILIALIIETFIATIQFYSPQSAWINTGVGGAEVIGFTGGLGFFRPPGTFSFTNGLSAFLGLATPFVFYFWVRGGQLVKKWLLLAATIALIIAIPISISRTVFYQVGLTAAFTIVIASRKPKMLAPVVGAGFGLLALVVLLSNLSFFATGIAAFTDRFNSASISENAGQAAEASTVANSVLDRYFGGIFSAIESSDRFPFFGLGLGFGTNAGAQFLTGSVKFTISEGEWGRVIGEMGVLLGLLFIIIRVAVALQALAKGYKRIRQNNYLPWLLASFTFSIFIQGQWAQPTSLGFAILGMGLNLAAFNIKAAKA